MALRDTLFLNVFGLFRIPMVAFLTPAVVELDDHRAVLRIALTRRSRNHLKSMYFGALCTGADLTPGTLALRLIRASGEPIQFVFKDVQAEFLKRAEGDVHFTCEDGDAIAMLIGKAATSGERENLPIHVSATVPSVSLTEVVAKFTMTLSVKKRKAKSK